jgi:two-component system, NtrC family, response regulator AtoC
MTTVLCIGGDAGILEIKKALLEPRGYIVLTAPDGETGVAISRKHSVDVTVLDFNMAGMDSYKTAAILMKEQPTVPVVICSGSADELPESLKWFADALVSKSDGPEALFAAIEKAMGFNTAAKRSPIRATAGSEKQLSAYWQAT